MSNKPNRKHRPRTRATHGGPIKLKVIPEPTSGTRAVMTRTGPETVFVAADAAEVYVCGACEAPLLVGVPRGFMNGPVLKCARCEAYNDTGAGVSV